MGIPGIYKEIGPGERIALAKLAVEQFEKTGRPLRIAIDISIWQFQIQSGRGGKNPALRTLYYRLLKLLALSIQPLFVFDGPQKPPFKRGNKTTPNTACLPNFLTKELLKRFGFPYHTAPGEAEAECALLQRESLVDAVLSEDVDTLMFGCTLSLRNWTAEAARGNKSPTHVNVYRAATTKTKCALDSKGMILVALMSGGDYIPAGIPGCGIRIACQAAKAGFGRDLCKIPRDDVDGLKKWKENLERELRTNESKLFRQRHKAITVPESFPNMTVLGYYTDPVVSSPEKVSRLRNEIKWDSDVNVLELRLFVSEAFEWQYLSGAKKFIRGLAPALLAQRCMRRSNSVAQDYENLEAKRIAEARLIKAIGSRRIHWNTDGAPELRVAYIPAEVVGLDLSTEEEDDLQGYAKDGSADEKLASGDDGDKGRSPSPTKRRGPSTYNPTSIEKIWMLETYVKLGVPLLAETWAEDVRVPAKLATRKAREKKTLSKAEQKSGSMDQFVKITKAGLKHSTASIELAPTKADDIPPQVLHAPAIATPAQSLSRTALAENRKSLTQKVKRNVATTPKAAKLKNVQDTSARGQLSSSPLHVNLNPWTLSKRPSDTLGFKSSIRYSALGIYPSEDLANEKPLPTEKGPRKEKVLVSDQLSPLLKKVHSRPITPVSDGEGSVSAPQNQQPNTDPSTPRRRDPSKPSPRKKRSPLELANELYLAGKLRTPTSIRTEKLCDLVSSAEEQPSSPQKVNRKLDFTMLKTTPPAASPCFDTFSLPSPSALISPVAPKHMKDSGECPSPSRAEAYIDKETQNLVALRESLEGAWKRLEPWEVEASSVKKVFETVEVLDLTAG